MNAFLGRLLIWRAGLYILGVMSSAVLGALSGMNWAEANTQTRLMVTIGVLGTAAGTLGAYIDQTAARVAKGELPFVDIPNETTAPTPNP